MTGIVIVERLREFMRIGNFSPEDKVRPLLMEAIEEIERLRAALQEIVKQADSDDGLTAWDGGDIARQALEEK